MFAEKFQDRLLVTVRVDTISMYESAQLSLADYFIEYCTADVLISKTYVHTYTLSQDICTQKGHSIRVKYGGMTCSIHELYHVRGPCALNALTMDAYPSSSVRDETQHNNI